MKKYPLLIASLLSLATHAETYSALTRSKNSGGALKVALKGVNFTNRKNLKLTVEATMVTDTECLEADGEGGCLKDKVIGQHCEKTATSKNVASDAQLLVTDLQTGESKSLKNISYYLYATASSKLNVPCDQLATPNDFALLASTPKFEREELAFETAPHVGSFTVSIGAIDLGIIGKSLHTNLHASESEVDLNSIEGIQAEIYVTDGDSACENEKCECLNVALKK